MTLQELKIITDAIVAKEREIAPLLERVREIEVIKRVPANTALREEYVRLQGVLKTLTNELDAAYEPLKILPSSPNG